MFSGGAVRHFSSGTQKSILSEAPVFPNTVGFSCQDPNGDHHLPKYETVTFAKKRNKAAQKIFRAAFFIFFGTLTGSFSDWSQFPGPAFGVPSSVPCFLVSQPKYSLLNIP